MFTSRSRGTEPGRPVRQREIATRVGVSASTVSRVLNGINGVSADVQRRVLVAAAELGYDDGTSRRLRQLNHVSLLVPASRTDSHNAFLPGVLAGVEAECRAQGIHLDYAMVEPGLPGRVLLRDKIERHRVDGILLLSVDDVALVEQILTLGVPTVVINAEYPGLFVDTFVPDDDGGSTLAVRHLLDHGHRRILHITYQGSQIIRRRHAAYRQTLEEAGMRYDPALVVDVSLPDEHTYEVMKARLTTQPPDFTAIFSFNDMAAVGAMRALREAGYRVPEDISIVGFDDVSMAALLSPPLTTVRIEREELGALAVGRLLDRAAVPTLTPIRVELATRLVERQSVSRVHASTLDARQPGRLPGNIG